MKYIVVTGSVVPGISKGIVSSSIGTLFQAMGQVVTMIKVDPYLNCDFSTLWSQEHRESFVLADGSECDLDLGNYERFLDVTLTRDHNITTGRIYQTVIEKERRGDYLGATVQMIPHITNEIISHIQRTSMIPINDKIPDICIIEIGVGEANSRYQGMIEVLPFIEALQQMRNENFCFVHVTMAINNPKVKTKLIQHNVATLHSRDIFPDILIIRCQESLSADVIQKLQRRCQIDNIISHPITSNIYQVPTIFHLQDICSRIGAKLQIPVTEINPIPFAEIADFLSKDHLSLPIGIIGKSPNTYLSLICALEHAAFACKIRLIITWINSEQISSYNLANYSAFIIPGGFGGIEGKSIVAKYAREHKVPILGICLGMHVMIVDCVNAKFPQLKVASSEWTDPGSENVLIIDQNKTGTMRLGDHQVHISHKTTTWNLYKTRTVTERHRHRYEVNNDYFDQIDDSGLIATGIYDDDLVEIVEFTNHPFYIGCSYYPEFNSRVHQPHPLFVGLLSAANK